MAENALADYIASKRTAREADLKDEVELSGREFQFVIDRGNAPIQGYETITVEVRMDRGDQVLASLTTMQEGQVR